MTLGASPHMAPGGLLLMQYADPTMGERHRFEMHVAHFDPSTLSYTRDGAKVPSEAVVAETYAALGALWAAYYPATWVLQLLALYYNDGGSLSLAPAQPSTAPISGTNGAASVAGPSVRRFYACRSLAGGRRGVRFAQMPGNVIGTTADLSATGGGIDERDVNLLAYLSGSASGAVCPDGFAFADHATVILSDDRPLAPPPFDVGAQGVVPTPCLYFASHGATICNDDPGVIHVNTPAAQHSLDSTGYRLPAGDRLEEHRFGQTPNPLYAPVLAAVPGTTQCWPAGTYEVAYTYLMVDGETGLSPAAAITVDGTEYIKFSPAAFPPDFPTGSLRDTNIYLVPPLPTGSALYTGYLNDLGTDPWRVLVQNTHPGMPQPPAQNTTGVPGWRIVDPTGWAYLQHDGTTLTVQGGAGGPVLEAPLPTLGTAPATLVGKDPATGLPAFCPVPRAAQTTYVAPVDPVPPPSGTPASNAACGAAHAMADRLARFYELATGCVRAALNILGPVAATLIIDAALDYFTAGTAGTWMSLNGDAYAAMKAALGGVLTAVEAGVMPPLDGQGKTAIINTAYHAIGALPTLPIRVTQATIAAWGANLGADPGDFTGSQDAILQLLTHVLPLDQWQQEANTGSSNPQSGCM